MRTRDLKKKARDDLLKSAVVWWFNNQQAGHTRDLAFATVSYFNSLTPEDKKKLISADGE